MSLGEHLAKWGSMYPSITINEVLLSVEEENVVVNAFGQLPLYKSHAFEQNVKKSFIKQLAKRQADLKDMLQVAERKLWDHFPFSQKFQGGVSLNSSLSEPMRIKGDHLHVSFMNEFDQVDQSEFEIKPRHINPTFDTENKDFNKDI